MAILWLFAFLKCVRRWSHLFSPPSMICQRSQQTRADPFEELEATGAPCICIHWIKTFQNSKDSVERVCWRRSISGMNEWMTSKVRRQGEISAPYWLTIIFNPGTHDELTQEKLTEAHRFVYRSRFCPFPSSSNLFSISKQLLFLFFSTHIVIFLSFRKPILLKGNDGEFKI